MGFSSRFFKVNEKLNLQRKRYVKSRQVNLTLSRFIRLLQDKNAQSEMKQLSEKKKNYRFCLQTTTAQIGLTTQET